MLPDANSPDEPAVLISNRLAAPLRLLTPAVVVLTEVHVVGDRPVGVGGDDLEGGVPARADRGVDQFGVPWMVIVEG